MAHWIKVGSVLTPSLILITFIGLAQTLIINEVSNGANGNKEYVEFVVVDTTVAYNCNGDSPPCIDIRGWIFDDNSGYHGAGGVAQGALRFSNDPLWSCLPLGTIILLYNDADPGLLIPPNDLTLADNNCSLVVPISSNLIEKNSTTPGAVSCSYPTTGWTAGGNWNNVVLANAGDCSRIVDLSGCEVFSLCWASCNSNTLIYFNSSGSGSQNVWYFNGDDPTQQGNWSEGSASGGDETPGAPNNAANEAYIAQFNNDCQPIPLLTSNASATDADCGACNGTASVNAMGSIPGYTFQWFDANYTSIGQTTAAVNGLCVGAHHVIITSSIGCTDTAHVAIQSIGNGVSTSETVEACLGSSITFPDGMTELVVAPTVHTSMLVGSSGCDSIITTNVSIVNAYAQVENITICEGTSLTYADGTTEVVTGNTVHVSMLTSSAGCDSVVTTNVTALAAQNLVETLEVCLGTTINYPDGTTVLVTQNTSHVSFLTSIQGCDSIITTNVNVEAGYLQQQYASICMGESYTFADGTTQLITANLSHTSIFSTVGGCDSLIITSITALTSAFVRETISLCEGVAYTFPDGTVIDPVVTDVVYSSVLTNAQGCDSVVQTTVHVQTDALSPEFSYLPVVPDQDHNEVTFTTNETGSLHWTVTDLNGQLLYASTDTGFVYTFPSDSIFAHVVCLEIEQQGCMGTTCTTVTLEAEPTIYIPNAFTPHGSGDGNGINDVFLPVIGGGLAHRYRLEIYDRWGEKLFETTDPYEGWNGYFKGELVPKAVYAYRLQFAIQPLTFMYRYVGHVNVVR